MEFKLPARNASHNETGGPIKKNIIILALGAESAGNFSVYQNGIVYFSRDFGDLLEIDNFNKYKAELGKIIKNKKINPDIILTDLHPDFLTTHLGKELAKKYHAKHIQVQHHLAHIFSALGNKIIQNTRYQIPNTIYGIALDGTGYGTDGKIWGGECFAISNFQFSIFKQFSISKSQISKQELQIKRIGHLENQTMISGELAIKEPARILIAILDKVFSKSSSPLGRRWREATDEGKGKLQKKNIIYSFVKKYYSRNEFELLYNQLQQNFNCVETSSAGRILDAVSLLLGFCENERNYKHEPVDLLEANSTKPYTDLKPKIDTMKNDLISNFQFPISNQFSMIKFKAGSGVPPEPYISEKAGHILQTTPLFEYLIKNLHKDKSRLAATTQLYIAQGLYEIIKKNIRDTKYKIQNTFFSGGLANNKIISQYLESKNIYANKKIPRGDAGISFGQIVYFLFDCLKNSFSN